MSHYPQYEVPERRYDSASGRLFLVYYPIVSGYNGNRWGVSEHSLDTNIQTAVNKPVVIYRKNPTNRFHTRQAGNFVHPTPEEAATELGHYPTAEEYYNWQERFAVGRVRNVEKRDKGYAFTLEITDPEAKNILKSDAYSDGIPGWTSPQIVSNGHLYPEEERSEIYNHWSIAHIALLDIPAYGKEQAGARAKCFGAEKDCMITTRSASQQNLGFCVKQAAIDLVNAFSNSSQVDSESTNSHTMSQSENTATKSSETVTYTGTPENSNPPVNAEPSQKEQQQQTLPISQSNEEQQQQQQQQQQPKPVEGAKSLEEANAQIRQMQELLAETNKQLKAQQKELDRITLSERKARLAFIIPRDLFKSDDSHLKEVEKALTENVSESFLKDYWNTKRQLALMQTNSKRTEESIQVKSASIQEGHDVPDFSSSQNSNVRSNIQKQLELQKMILDGGLT